VTALLEVPSEILRVSFSAPDYRRDYWLHQPIRLGVWSEKGTVRGTLAPVLDAYQVPWLVTHGLNPTRILLAKSH
jgi:hypothetical protein